MRKIIIAISCCIALLLAAYAGYRGYLVWKQNHLLDLAKTFTTDAGYRNKLLCLQQVLQVNPRNIEACRMMAELNESMRANAAIVWRERVVELEPKSAENRLALAQTAMMFKEFTVATNTLASLDDAARSTSQYHNIAGLVAVGLGQLSVAGKHFAEAARLAPGDLGPQVSLAVVRLNSSNELDMAEARISLKRISMESTNAALRTQALRELMADSLRSKNLENALVLAETLARPTNAAFSDKLLLLDILKKTRNPSLQTELALCKKEAAENPAKLAEMTGWLMSRSSPAEALTWMQSLPAAAQTNQPAALLIAQCEIIAQNWAQLQSSLEKQNWGDLEFSRHAILARALRGQNMAGASSAEWEIAIKNAGSSKATLILLFRLAVEWKWIDEAEQILWTIVNRHPEEQWAAQQLQQALFLGGRTRPLMQFYSLQSKRMPNNPAIRNDLAMTAMLLDAQEILPFEMARKAYESASTNAAYASTYAFALYLQKQYPAALKVMQSLRPEDLNDPANAGYYGLILKANGDVVRGRTYLNWAISKGKLLPEERKMFEQALKG